LFTRGIPIIFYGTEIGIKGGPKDGELRQPFPGGFFNDERNAFIQKGRTEVENEIYNYLQKLLKLRKDYPVLSKGTLRHIYPTDNVYLLIKELKDETALVFINSSEIDLPVQPSQLKMFLPGADVLLNLKSNEEINLNQNAQIIINKLSAEIFLVRK
jgi:glycosidase